MRSPRQRFTSLAGLLLLAGLWAPGAARAADCSADPNVVFLVDTSGSMAQVTWHPAFDPLVPTACSSHASQLNLLADETQSHCGTLRTYRVDPALAARGIRTRFDASYLNWLHDLPDGHPFLQEIDAPDSGTASACLGGAPYPAFQESRLTAAKRFVRDVVCRTTAVASPRLGLARPRVGSDPAGGYLSVPVDDATPAHLANLELGIDDLEPIGWGPLGESLFHTYTYAMSRSAADTAFGVDGTTRFPPYTADEQGDPTVSPPPSPVQDACQEHLVVVLADDAPTRDDFDPGGPGSDSFELFAQLIGNYNPDDAAPEAGDEEPGQSPTCTSTSCEVALYLDDIALFAHVQDFRPDLGGVQTLRVFTVAFGIDLFGLQLLAKTADVGGGFLLTPEDAGFLADEILAAAPQPPAVPALGPAGKLAVAWLVLASARRAMRRRDRA